VTNFSRKGDEVYRNVTYA